MTIKPLRGQRLWQGRAGQRQHGAAEPELLGWCLKCTQRIVSRRPHLSDEKTEVHSLKITVSLLLGGMVVGVE